MNPNHKTKRKNAVPDRPPRYGEATGKHGAGPLPFEAIGPCLAELRQQLALRQAMS